jgi:APA family basic amino acid/polyamine antiporter
MVPLVADASLQPQTLAAIKTTIAVAVVALCTVQHCVGLHSGARWQTVVVLGKVLMLVLLVVVGLTLMAGQDAPASNAKIVAPNLGVLASSLTWMALAFSGFNAAIYVASEVDNAPRTVPRAMLTGTLVVAGLYLALNYVFVFAGPIESLAGKPDIAAQSFALLGSDRWAMVCRAVVAVALLTSVSANLMAGPRVYDRMAADGLFPLRAIPPGGVPRLAIVVQALLAAVVIAFSSLRQQLDYLGVLLSLSAALTVGSLFWRRGDRDLPLTPLVAVAAALFTTASLLFACYALVHNFRQLGSVWIAVAATLVSGVVFYFAMRWWRAKSIEPTK